MRILRVVAVRHQPARCHVSALVLAVLLTSGAAAGDAGPSVVPSEDVIARETQTIRSALRIQYERAKADDDARPLIATLTKMAGVSDPGPRKYALMLEAERIALEEQLFGVALRGAEERSSMFNAPIWQERLKIVDAMAVSPVLDHVEEAIVLSDFFVRLALSREDFPVAREFRTRLAAFVDEYAKREKSREEDLRKSFSRVVEMLKKRNPRGKVRSSWEMTKDLFPHRRKAQYAALLAEVDRELRDTETRAEPQPASRTAAGKGPGDVAAGMRLCLDRYSWPEGLAQLVNGDGIVADAARQEARAGSTASDVDRIAIADAWWNAGEQLLADPAPNLSDVASIRSHAAELYMQSMAKVGDPLIETVGKDRIQAADPPRILVEVGRAALNAASPDEAIVSYEMYLARTDITAPQRRAAEVQLECWKLRAAAKSVRHGDKWLPAELRLKSEQDANARLEYGIKLLADGKLDMAEAEFVAASELDPSSPIAESVLAWLYFWVKGRDFFWTGNDLLATEYYREAVRRDPANGVVLTNLANCEVITGRHLDAAVHYQRAIDVLPDPVVANNIGWAVRNSRPLGLSEANLRRFNDLYRRALTDLDIKETDNDDLKFFKPFVVPITSGTDAPKGRSDTNPAIISAGSGTGFVVAPGYVVTNHHVVEGATEITVSDPANPAKRYPAKVVASATGHANGQDLALLRCEGLPRNDGIPLAEQVAPRGEDVMALGFPSTDVLGKALKSTRGAVVSAVDESGLFFLDCIINPGNSGGPIVDDRGRVIGAVVAITKRELLVGNAYSLGIPVEAIRAFLEKHLPDEARAHVTDRATAASKEPLKWSEVDATVSTSTVFIQTIVRRGGAAGGDGSGSSEKPDGASAAPSPSPPGPDATPAPAPSDGAPPPTPDAGSTPPPAQEAAPGGPMAPGQAGEAPATSPP